MPIYKYIKEFLIPPGIYISIFVIALLYLWFIYYIVRNNVKAASGAKLLQTALLSGMVSCFICAIGTYAMCINAGAQRIMHSLEYKYENKSVTPDAIIVLGATYGRSVTAATPSRRLPQCHDGVPRYG